MLGPSPKDPIKLFGGAVMN